MKKWETSLYRKLEIFVRNNLFKHSQNNAAILLGMRRRVYLIIIQKMLFRNFKCEL